MGGGALYLIASLSGVADMDAITLSTARLVERGSLEASQGWRLVVVAIMTNMVFKTVVVWVVGARALLWRTAIIFGATVGAGAVLLVIGDSLPVFGAAGGLP